MSKVKKPKWEPDPLHDGDWILAIPFMGGWKDCHIASFKIGFVFRIDEHSIGCWPHGITTGAESTLAAAMLACAPDVPLPSEVKRAGKKGKAIK